MADSGDLYREHIGYEPAPDASDVPERFRLTVEACEGCTLQLDARRVRSMDMLERVAAIQRGGDTTDIAALLDLYDYMLGDQKQPLEDFVEAERGYVDYARYIELAGAVFEAVSKN